MTDPAAGAAGEVSSTVYERVGGDAWFEALTARFYTAVADDPVLPLVYPDDLAAAEDRFCGFLIQYWGGPASYSNERGHPRLRVRHVPFAIGLPEREAWYRHMAAAVKAGGLSADDEVAVLRYTAGTSLQLINLR